MSKCTENIWEGIHKELSEKSLLDKSYPANIDGGGSPLGQLRVNATEILVSKH